jgi:hypothetical protein
MLLNVFVSCCYRYAHYLFENGSYEEAMDHFLASQVDITYVLSLYPSIILPKTTIVHEPEKLDIESDASHLSRVSSGLSDDMDSPSDESAALESKKTNHNMLMALIKYLQKKRGNFIEKATAEGTEEVVLDAVGDSFASYNRFKKANKVRQAIFYSLFNISPMSDDNDYGLNLVQLATHAFQLEANQASVMPI